MTFWDLPKSVKVEIKNALDNRPWFDDFPICVYRGVYVYTFWAYDLPVDKCRVELHEYL